MNGAVDEVELSCIVPNKAERSFKCPARVQWKEKIWNGRVDERIYPGR